MKYIREPDEVVDQVVLNTLRLKKTLHHLRSARLHKHRDQNVYSMKNSLDSWHSCKHFVDSLLCCRVLIGPIDNNNL